MKNEDTWQIPLYIALRTFLFACNFISLLVNVRFWQHFTIWYWTFKREKWDFRVNAHSPVCLNVKELLGRSRHHIWSLSISNVIWTHKQMIELCCACLSVRCIWLYVIIMSCTSFRENPHSIVCLNVKELLARSWRNIWSLSDSNVISTHNHLVCKQTLNHLAKLVKWLSCVVRAYLYRTFDCILSCHVRISEWIHTL